MKLHFENKLLKRLKLGNFRQLQPPLQSIDFSSNDYLGLARSPYLKNAVMKEWELYKNELNGLGSTGSRLLTGNSSYTQNLEKSIATFHGFEEALLFNSGYMANMGLLSTIANEKDCILYDIGIHASTKEGIRLSQAKRIPFKHNNCEHLENRLKRCSEEGNRFICVESIYSTDGSIAPLQEICRLARQYEARLIVDEAHAIGVLGPSGKGLVEELCLHSNIFALVVTFGKALGTLGGAVLGNKTLKLGLINFASSYIYTTALPFLSLAAIKCSYDLFPSLKSERIHLQKLVQFFRKTQTSFSVTQIQSIKIKGNQPIKHVAENLIKNGFDVRALMSPTVQRGQETLRICLHAFNTENEISSLLKQIEFYKRSI